MEFWKEESSLYQIIKDHLDQEGYFDPDLIEDQNFVDTYAVLFREPGTSDSYMASMPDRPQEEVGSVIAGALAAYAKNPDSKAEKELYASISSVPFIIYNDYLVDLLSTQEIPDALWNLCHRWLYHAFAPEVLKLAITVTGLHLLNEENLNEVERLHKDLMLLARCEELTSFVVYALELGHLLENEDLWEILTHTRGWGRVCAMSTYDFITPEENIGFSSMAVISRLIILQWLFLSSRKAIFSKCLKKNGWMMKPLMPCFTPWLIISIF